MQLSEFKPPLQGLKFIEWLVSARYHVQFFMVNLYKKMPEVNMPKEMDSVDWQSFIGAAFSLWRAAFLLDPKGRGDYMTHQNARSLLQKLIKENAIGFGDEVRLGLWTGGYYLNNARYRVQTIKKELVKMEKVHPNDDLSEIWNETFTELYNLFEAKTVDL